MTNLIFKVNYRQWLAGYKKFFLILITIALGSSVSAQVESPSKILLNFSEQMSRENIFDPTNYKVTANENIPVKVIKVGLVQGDSSVVLFFNKEEGWLSFKIIVQNLKDKAGNLINNDKNFAEIAPSLQKNIPERLIGEK